MSMLETALEVAKKLPGALTGLIVYPLTMPFLSAANRFHKYNQRNKAIWRDYSSRKSVLPGLNYILGAMLITLRVLFLSLVVPVDFALNIIISLIDGARFGYSDGIGKTLKSPEAKTNVYDYEGHDRGDFNIRSQHLLKLALFLGVLGGIAGIILLGSGLFSPLAYLSSHYGMHIFTKLGIKHVSQAIYWATTFLFSAGVIATATSALSAAVFTFMRLCHGFGSLIESLSPKDGNTWQQNAKQLIAIPQHLGHFVNQVLGVAIGLPIYMLFKPTFQLLHSTRECIRSNRRIFRSGWKNAELKHRLLGEVFFKFITLVQVLLNTAIKFIIFPFQFLGSLLYAPFQCIRHATKYGLAQVLNYPYHYINNYQVKLKHKDRNRVYTGLGQDYDHLMLSQYENVYYFKLKHVLILSLVVGLIFLGLTGILSLHGYLGINLTLTILTPLGLNSLHLAGTSVALFNFLAGIVLTNVAALAVYIAARTLSFLSNITSAIEHVAKGARRFNSIFHKVVNAGEAARVMKQENLAVKTIASKVRKEQQWQDEEAQRKTLFGPSWIFNIEQFHNPSGFNPIGKNTPRPVYLEKERVYKRNATYKRWNPKNGEWEERNMRGIRGRARPDMWLKHYLSLSLLPMYTKKTSVSLAPKDGMMAYFGGRDDAVGIAFDLEKLDLKDEKYVFTDDAWTNLKWWWQSKQQERAMWGRRSITIQELRNTNRISRLQSKVPEHNEILAGVSKEALLAIIVSTKNRATRINALLRKLIIKRELGIDLPILIMGTLNKHGPGINEEPQIPKEYSVEQQIVDLYGVIHERFDDGKETLKQATEYYEGKGFNAKHKFVETLVHSNHLHWASVFKKLRKQNSKSLEHFKSYIQTTTGVNLDESTHHKFSESHLMPPS